MAKYIPKTGSRKNVRIGSRNHTRKIPKGIIQVQASFNNTIVTITDVRGRVISWSSAGTCGFKGTRRGTPFAAQTAAGNAIRTVSDQGMQRAEIMIKGPGLGRDATLRAIRRSGILLNFIRDVTPMPHNGCRSPKKDVYKTKNKHEKYFKRNKQVKSLIKIIDYYGSREIKSLYSDTTMEMC
ncbi:hypothetical protein PHAVU_001G047500 [Phaseolus vulgaris]|uniref:Small ribosomal subunit protein uS11c n=1 Tax=Phaseolus vulgaris TaxID=3885 RepID=V7CUV5_PHAVU|nr:hypothetical protein PHAVU_001G047500g [Phaseolus vulgaris]ESW33153.1 hypothetical protein PHAVU_001G047500g [Phaseolus vulgaris]